MISRTFGSTSLYQTEYVWMSNGFLGKGTSKCLVLYLKKYCEIDMIKCKMKGYTQGNCLIAGTWASVSCTSLDKLRVIWCPDIENDLMSLSWLSIYESVHPKWMKSSACSKLACEWNGYHAGVCGSWGADGRATEDFSKSPGWRISDFLPENRWYSTHTLPSSSDGGRPKLDKDSSADELLSLITILAL